MKPVLCLFAALAAGLIIGSCSPAESPKPSSPHLAEVNGEPITLAQLNHRMKFLNLGFANISAGDQEGDARLEALSQLIQEAMYLQEAKRIGIRTNPVEVEEYIGRLSREYPKGVLDKSLERSGLTRDEFRAEAARKITFDKLIDSQVYSRITVEDSQLRRYFDEHKDEFHQPAQVRVRQIVVDSEDAARSILNQIKAGADFSALAKARSLSPDGEMGGDLGYFSRGQMPPEFDEVVFRMKPGELSGVVHTPYGFHIFLVDDIRPASKPSFDEVKGLVKKRLLSRKGEEAYLAWQSALRERSSVEVHTEALGRL